jgi:hypothetical protein
VLLAISQAQPLYAEAVLSDFYSTVLFACS